MYSVTKVSIIKLFIAAAILIIAGYLAVYELTLHQVYQKYKAQQTSGGNIPVSNTDLSKDYVSLKGGNPQAGAINVSGDIAGNDVQGQTITSTVQNGTSPLNVTSSTLVNNLNADMVDGKHADELTKTTVNNITNTTTGESIQPGTTGQYYRGDKSWQTLNSSAVGLGNVENTALSTWTGSNQVAILGTVTSGTWNAGAINAAGSITGTALQGTSLNLGSGTIIAGTINGATISGGTLSGGNISGGTVQGGTLSSTAVNGVTTANILINTGSYSDPSWLQGLAGSKITGDISGNASGLTGTPNITVGTISSGNITSSGTLSITGTGNSSVAGNLGVNSLLTPESLGPELDPNPTLDNNCNGWTIGGPDWVCHGNYYSHDSYGTSYTYLTNGIPSVIGQVYKLTFTVSGYSAGSFDFYVAGDRTPTITANGTYTFYLKARYANDWFFPEQTANSLFALDNIYLEAQNALPVYSTITAGDVVTRGGSKTDVRAFGAKCDGVTDDSAAIQAAEDSLPYNGGTLFFPAGTCIGHFTVKSNVHIMGSGIEATVLKLPNGANTDVINTQDFNNLTGTDSQRGALRVTLENITLDGNKGNNSSGYCLKKYGAQWNIHDTVFRNGASGGMYAEWGTYLGIPYGADSMEDKWSNIWVHDNNGAYAIWMKGPHDSVMTNSLIYANAGSGIFIDHSGSTFNGGGLTINDTHIWGNSTTGYGILSDTALRMNGDIVEGESGSGGVGIRMYQNYDTGVLTATNLEIFGNETGILLDANTQRNNISGVYVHENTNGIKVLSNENNITGALITWQTSGTGLIMGDGTHVVSNNNIEGKFYNNATSINWGNPSNTNDSIDALISTSGGQTALSGSPSSTNKLNILSAGSGANTSLTNIAGQLSIESAQTSGNLTTIAAPSAVTATGDIVGQRIDLRSNYTISNHQVTGSWLSMPNVTNSSATSAWYNAYYVDGGSLQNAGIGNDYWTGFGYQEPNITTTSSGSITSVGIELYKPSTISGANAHNYSIIVDPGAGNVGIGTTAPASLLTVNAPVTTDSSTVTAMITSANAANKGLVVQGYTSQTADLIQAQSSLGAVLFSVDNSGNITTSGNTAKTIAEARNTSNAAGNNLTVQSGGAYAGGTDLNGGNLIAASGISTGLGSSNIYLQTASGTGSISSVNATPTTSGSGYSLNDILTISEGSGGQVKVTGVSSGQVTAVTLYAAGIGYTTGTGKVTTGGTGTGCSINITGVSSGTTDQTPSTKMTILGNGNVGIGTTAPGAKLTIQGNAVNNGAAPIMEIQDSTGAELFRINANVVDNLFIGNSAGNAIQTPGVSTQGLYDTFIGTYSGMHNTTGHYNTFIGNRSGSEDTTGDHNTAIGMQSGYNITTGQYNTYLGITAGQDGTTANHNVAIGDYAGIGNVNGDKNIFVGSYSGYNRLMGIGEILQGYNAGSSGKSGGYNISLGVNSLYNDYDGIGNVSLGTYSLFSNKSSTDKSITGFANYSGSEKVTTLNPHGLAVGDSVYITFNSMASTELTHSALYTVQSVIDANDFTIARTYDSANDLKGYWERGATLSDNGSGKVRVTSNNHGVPNGGLVILGGTGANSSYDGMHTATLIDANHFDLTDLTYSSSYTTGWFEYEPQSGNNTAVGSYAGYANTTGYNNTFLGYNAGNAGTTGTLQNAAAIGYNAQVTESNAIVLGGTGSSAVNVGIGTTAPGANLEIDSNAAGTIVQIIKAYSGQTADLLEIQGSDTSVLAKIDASGNLTAKAASFTGTLTVTGHFKSTQTTAPTIGTPTSCGTTPTAAVTAGSTDSAGSLTITAGTGAPGNCAAQITFNTAYGAAPKSIILTPSTATGPAKQAYISASSATTFTVTFGTAPTASEANTFYYWVVE